VTLTRPRPTKHDPFSRIDRLVMRKGYITAASIAAVSFIVLIGWGHLAAFGLAAGSSGRATEPPPGNSSR
jgi:hypothetical protein